MGGMTLYLHTVCTTLRDNCVKCYITKLNNRTVPQTHSGVMNTNSRWFSEMCLLLMYGQTFSGCVARVDCHQIDLIPI